MPYALLAMSIVVALWWFTRTSALFRLDVASGTITRIRGRVPNGLVGEFRRIVRAANVRHGVIRVEKTERGGRLTTSGGIDAGTEQRLRNVFGLYPASQLRHAPVIGKPTFGQLVGAAWLGTLIGSLFDRSRDG